MRRGERNKGKRMQRAQGEKRQQIHIADKINSRVICLCVCLRLGRRQMEVIGP